jgi:hypothetical protein
MTMNDRERLELLLSPGPSGGVQAGCALASALTFGLIGLCLSVSLALWLDLDLRELATVTIAATVLGAWEGLLFGRRYWARMVAESAGILGHNPRWHIGGESRVWIRINRARTIRIDLPIYHKYLEEIALLALRGVPFTYRGYRKYFPVSDQDEHLATFRNVLLFLGYLDSAPRGEVVWNETGLTFWEALLSGQVVVEPAPPSPTYLPG